MKVTEIKPDNTAQDFQELMRQIEIDLADIDRRLTIQEQKRQLGGKGKNRGSSSSSNYFRDLEEVDEEPQLRVVVTPNGEVYRL